MPKCVFDTPPQTSPHSAPLAPPYGSSAPWPLRSSHLQRPPLMALPAQVWCFSAALGLATGLLCILPTSVTLVLFFYIVKASCCCIRPLCYYLCTKFHSSPMSIQFTLNSLISSTFQLIQPMHKYNGFMLRILCP